MLIFVALAIAGFLVLVSSFIFGHDADHDAEPGADHDSDHDTDGTISFFSTKVITTLIMCFGAAGAIARHHELSVLLSSMIGLGSGICLSLLMWGLLKVLYKQQGSSIVPTEAALGLTGRLLTSIDGTGLGEVGLTIRGDYKTYSARSANGKSIKKGLNVRVVQTSGPELIVETVQ